MVTDDEDDGVKAEHEPLDIVDAWVNEVKTQKHLLDDNPMHSYDLYNQASKRKILNLRHPDTIFMQNIVFIGV